MSIAVTSQTLGGFHVDGIKQDSIDEVNRLLQHNHEAFHVIYNPGPGMHNHHVHYLLTDLSLGATPAQLRQAYQSNESYQRPIDAGAEGQQIVINEENYTAALGKFENYAAWLVYFEAVIARKGWQQTMQEYLFAKSPRADDMLGRMFDGRFCSSEYKFRANNVAGAIHPIIHLGFGVEYAQSAVVAEGLAMAAIHADKCGLSLLRIEKRASTTKRRPGLEAIFLESRRNTNIKDDPNWEEGSLNRGVDFYSGMPDDLIDLAASYQVDFSSDASLQKQVAEMMSVSAWFAVAAQSPQKQVKIDFFLMHCVNLGIFLKSFADLTWLDLAAKARILEWKVRMDLIIYVHRGCPELRISEIQNYVPRRSDSMNWDTIIDRSKNIPDDGHVVKMIRALNQGHDLSQPLEAVKDDTISLPIRNEMWLKVANMVLDSTQDGVKVPDKWLFGPRYDQCWQNVADR